MTARHLLIKGKVQGVFYRATAKETADELGVTGWVRNTEEGDVEAYVYGAPDKVDTFIGWCRKGPSRAVVKEVVVSEAEPEAGEAFLILREH